MCLSQFLQGCRQPRDFLSQPSRKTSKIFCIIHEEFYICTTENGTSVFFGEMAEWSIAAVLKTVDCNRSGGSNPSFSATF